MHGTFKDDREITNIMTRVTTKDITVMEDIVVEGDSIIIMVEIDRDVASVIVNNI